PSRGQSPWLHPGRVPPRLRGSGSARSRTGGQSVCRPCSRFQPAGAVQGLPVIPVRGVCGSRGVPAMSPLCFEGVAFLVVIIYSYCCEYGLCSCIYLLVLVVMN